ncbi:glycosyl transferase family 39 [Thermodesulfobacterium geofontis OPF15]|jgi:4-amino-4-deoxy-L-arabinose transferase-like glycosyltransferase|uniref:Glycosyl transferase family 39 n=1 Tax=Thermodesulfobacterium geofontis (strain OPF15) TaxID=795359 RepID=F8C4B5_THEGP|nr:glycosyltransferase family 39 protein [Thermodesulfobacterium geofontis]AEH22616.1 glycosyl transferase family 39 [Thermodesulfobacterium geofontis OPF15]
MKKTLLIISILFLFGFALYLPFLGEKEFQGEEGRRVLIALQMLENKEFLIPELFDEPYFNKPPLFNWALAGFFFITKSYSEVSARFFSSLCLILTSLFLVFIWKNFLTDYEKNFPNPSLIEILIPGLIFLATPEVIDKAIRAEIDGFYTMLITIAVYSWFYLYEVKNKRKTAYIVSGIFLGLSILTKTFQALVFFYLTLFSYFLFKKRLKELLSIPHILGIFTYLGIFSIWAILVSLKIGFKPFIVAWIYQYLSLAKGQEMSFSQHFKAYTIFAFLGYSPWLLFLIFFKNKNFISFIKSNPLFYNLAIFSFFFFFLSYIFHFLFPGARLRYILPSASGLIFLSTLPIYYYIRQNLLPENLKALFLKIISIVNLILLVACFIYLSFSKYRPETIFYAFYFLFFLINLIVLLKTPSSPKYLFYFLLSIVFLLKTLYVSFYYPLHKEEINHFRNGAFEIANIIGNKKELYLCQTIPHHLLYYLKYKYKLIPHIYYLKNCSNLPKNSFILFMEKNIPEEILKNYKIYPLKIRTKSYFLVSS